MAWHLSYNINLVSYISTNARDNLDHSTTACIYQRRMDLHTCASQSVKINELNLNLKPGDVLWTRSFFPRFPLWNGIIPIFGIQTERVLKNARIFFRSIDCAQLRWNVKIKGKGGNENGEMSARLHFMVASMMHGLIRSSYAHFHVFLPPDRSARIRRAVRSVTFAKCLRLRHGRCIIRRLSHSIKLGAHKIRTIAKHCS